MMDHVLLHDVAPGYSKPKYQSILKVFVAGKMIASTILDNDSLLIFLNQLFGASAIEKLWSRKQRVGMLYKTVNKVNKKTATAS